jgi:hypothetical protein
MSDQQTPNKDNPNSIDEFEFTLCIGPGERHTNGDGVTVVNYGSSGNAYITPKDGNSTSRTYVRVEGNASVRIEGIDFSSTVNFEGRGIYRVRGTGGMINLNSGYAVISNTGQGSGPSIHVNIPIGQVNVTNGSTAIFNLL